MEKDQLLILDNWQKSFINEKIILNMAKSTISNYNNILNRLYDYYSQHESEISFYQIDRTFILSFLDSFENMSINTKNLYITVIKSFFKYISINNEDNIDFRDRFSNLKAKAKKSEPEYLNDYEYKLLVKYLDSSIKPSSFIQYRNRLLLKLLLYTGIRASELLNIKLEDFQTINDNTIYKIRILGKGNKERYVYISIKEIKKELEYINNYITNKLDITFAYISLTTKGRVMHRAELYSMIENLFKKIAIKKRGVHLFRHTFGKKMVQKNINLSTIKDLMGHENIQTTMIYARTDEGSMINAILV